MKEFTFIWDIQNYSYCWHGNGEMLESPEFFADILQTTTWKIEFFPKGDGEGRTLSYFLTRGIDDDGPEDLAFNYELSLLTADGLRLQSLAPEDREFRTGKAYGVVSKYSAEQLAEMKGGSKQLPLDVLVVRCRIRMGTGAVSESVRSSACTRIIVEKFFAVQAVQGFSDFEASGTKNLQVKSRSGGRPLMSIKVSVTDGLCCKEKVMVEITPAGSQKITILTCKLYLVDTAGKRIECGPAGARIDFRRKGTMFVPMSLTKRQLLDRKDEYLPKDVLTLQYECAFSTQLEFTEIERTDYGLHLMPSGTSTVQRGDTGGAVAKLSDCPSALDDLRSLYEEQALSDVAIKTATETFRAHKTVLAARSSVFKKMLTSDMKEKTDHCIEVKDLEGDIVRKLFLFLYSDKLEDLRWDTAIKLYYAADKYEVHRLKIKCSLFLMDNISVSNAIDLLLLADLHQDSWLKTVWDDFIIEHGREIFSSDAWEAVKETNPHLAMKTMQLAVTTMHLK